jgi:hypothetical protein
MRGPGAQSYGRLVEQLHRLSGQENTRNIASNLFVQADVLRSSIFGYFARQRRVMNKPCPSCPQEKLADGTWASVCPIITADAKRIGIPVRHHIGKSPDQTDENSPAVDVRKRCTAERFFWYIDAHKISRVQARALAGDVLGKILRKGDSHFQIAEATHLLDLVPTGYCGALRILLHAFNKGFVSAADGGSNAEGDNDLPEHGSYISHSYIY